MPNLRDIHTRLVELISGIEGVGKVHRYQRYLNNLDDLAKLYVTENPIPTEKQLKGWFIQLLDIKASPVGNGKLEKIVRFKIQGFLGISDKLESQLTMMDLVEKIFNALTVSSFSGIPVALSGVNLEAFNAVNFAGVLCHNAEIILSFQLRGQ